MSDPTPEVGRWAAALDDLAAAVFGSDDGAARVDPMLARWDEAVGPLREEDPDGAAWHAVRTDWALCDAPIDGAGDTWAWRAVCGQLAGVVPNDDQRTVATSVAGLWRVAPGRRPWLCDALSGVGVELSSSLRLVEESGAGPAALWEARVVIVDGIAELCRPPVSYPVAVADEVRRRGLSRLSSSEQTRHDTLLQLRRKWLHWARAPRADARLLFTRR